MIKNVIYKIDVDTLKRNQDHKELNTNSISKVQIRTTSALLTDEYNVNRNTGSFILIDDATNNTVAAGMVM